MTGIPRDAREVYCNEKGEPIAWCPVEGIGITDVERAQFFLLNEERLRQLAARAREKDVEGDARHVVVCIDVDDETWTPLVEALMPGFDWDEIRARGERPVARGVVPIGPIDLTIKTFYPAAGELADRNGVVNMVVFAGGGAGIFLDYGVRMNVGDAVKLNDKARKLPEPQRSKFKPGDKGKIEEVLGSLYVRVVFKKGTLRCPRGWLDPA